MARIKNISGDELIVPGLGGRLVMAGQGVDVTAGDVTSYTQQEQKWSPADTEAQDLHDEMLEAIAFLQALALPAPTSVDLAALMVLTLSEATARDVIDDVVSQATAEGLLVLLDVEQAGKSRVTVLDAARARLAELTGTEIDDASPTGGADQDTDPGGSAGGVDTDAQEG